MAGDPVWKCTCVIDGHHKQEVYSVSWSPSGHLATACGDNAVRVFRRVGKDPNAPKFELATSVQRAHDEDVNAVSWSPQPQGDGVSLLASASDDGTVKIWRFTAAS